MRLIMLLIVTLAIGLPSMAWAQADLRKDEVPIENANEIRIIDYAFSPPRITVTAGTKVTFTNSGSQAHNAAGADAGGWDTDILN